jgi:hypothetical protein
MDMKSLTAWVEAHPGESVVIGGGGLLLLLWLLGFFSSSTQAAPSQDPLAAAYYAAEAQQAVVGGQIQMNNADTAAQTAQTGINANAATTIAATNATAAQTINGQNADAAQTINQAQVTGAVTLGGQQASTYTTLGAQQAGLYTALGSDQLQATQINANAAQAVNASNNATFLSANQASIYGNETLAALNGIIPQELAQSGSALFDLPGEAAGIGIQAWTPPSPTAWQSVGFPAGEAQALGRWQLGGANPAQVPPSAQFPVQTSGA